MAIIGNSRLRRVTGLSAADRDRILDFLQGAVYCWCKNRERAEWFSLRDLMGGENFFWAGTPLITLWRKHDGRSRNPVKAAGIDGGWLLKRVIVIDRRTFRTRLADSFIREYQWDSTVPVPHE